MSTFNNYPLSHDGTFEGGKSDVAILGVPSDMGATGPGGQRDAPMAIRNAGAWNHDEMYDTMSGRSVTCNVVDAGDVLITAGDLIDTGINVAVTTREIMHNTNFLIVLGGDHSISRFVVSSLDNPYLVVFDAHSDLWEPATAGAYDHGTWLYDVLEAEMVSGACVVGHRCIGTTEDMWAAVDHIHADEYRADPDAALAKIVALANGRPTYLSIDIDVVDPAFAPGTGTPEPGGLTSWDILKAAYRLNCDLNTVAMDITEVLPARDVSDITTKLASRIIVKSLLAKSTVSL